MKSNLANLYSELDYLQRKRFDSNYSEERMAKETMFLDKVDEMVRPKIGRLRARAQYSKGFRRLLLSLSKVKVRRCRFDKADSLLTKLRDIYNRLIELDIVDRLDHVRALIALARISPLFEAEVRWNEALNLNKKYNPFEEEAFTCGLIYLFICSTRLKLENLDESKAAFNHAVEVFRKRRPQFLIPGVGTYLFDDVQC
jgi:tetratricopeptide (TPR) repeat protein